MDKWLQQSLYKGKDRQQKVDRVKHGKVHTQVWTDCVLLMQNTVCPNDTHTHRQTLISE